ncbi:hypothetical protein TMatcc_003067 [Talaromyces marneffei ATCC 18224]
MVEDWWRMVEFFAARREAGGLKLFSTFRWVLPARLLIRQPCRPTTSLFILSLALKEYLS